MARDRLAKAALDTGATGAISFVGSMLGLVAVLCMTRWLSPEVYAAVGVFVFVGQTARSLLSTWTLTAVIHFGKKELLEGGDARATFWSAAALMMPLLLLAGIVSLAGSHRLADYLDGGSSTLLLLAVYVATLSLAGLHTHWLQAVGAFRLSASLSTIDKGLVSILAITLAILGVGSASAARTVIVISIAASVIMGIFLRPPGRPRVERSRVASIGSFSIPIAVGVLAGTLFGWADFWVASRFLPSAELGQYYLASQGMAILLQLAMVINTVGGPFAIGLVAEGQTDRLARIYSRGIAQLCLLASSGLALGMALLTLLLPRVLTAYAGSVLPLVIMMAASAVAPAYFFSLAVFNACGRPRFITQATIVLGVSNLGLGLALVPRWGASGAAFAKGGALVLGALFAVWAASRLLETPGSLRALLAIAPAPAAAVAICALPEPSGALAAVVAMVVMSFAALRFGGILVSEDLNRFERAGIPAWLRAVLAIPLGGAS